MARLIGLAVSPWSEKAKWALAHHRVSYRYVEYVPMLGALHLRFLTGRFRGKVTVPVYVDEKTVLSDSLEIARYADEHGSGTPLFPSHEVEAWNVESEAALAAGRALTLVRVKADKAAQREQLPPFIPEALRGPARPMASLGITYVLRKYGAGSESADAHRATLRRVLEATRARLAGKEYLLGEFSYADIVMAVVFQFVKPVDERFFPLGPHTRAAFTLDEFVAEFPDLLAWRDRVYLRHRSLS